MGAVFLRTTDQGKPDMIDVIYLLVTIAFFALMLVFVRGCEMLGRGATDENEERKS
jgi:hypothetical protein